MPRQTRERYRLSREFMRGLVGNGKLQEYPDEAMPALELRLTPKGSASYSLRYQKPNGTQGRKTIAKWPATTPAEAREIARRELSITPIKSDPIAEQARKKTARATAQHIAGTMTLERFISERYEDHLKAHGKTGIRQANMIRAAFSDYLERDLTDLTAWAVEAWRTKRLKEGRSPSTCNRCINALRGALSRAIEWGVLEAPVNPLKTVKKMREPEPDTQRFLTAEEEARLRAALEAYEAALREPVTASKRGKRRRARHAPGTEASYADETTPLVLLALNLACRRGELLRCEWQRVDLANARVTFEGHSTKSGRTRTVALNREALDVFTRWRAQCAPDARFVFPDGKGEPLAQVKNWALVRDAAKITRLRLRFHDLRHAAASRLAMAGIDAFAISRVLGHRDTKMSGRYMHLSPQHMADVMAKLDEPNPVKHSHKPGKAG
jgi:integrase